MKHTIRFNVQNFIISVLLIAAMFRPRSFNLYSGVSRAFYILQILAVGLSLFVILTCALRKGMKYFGAISYLVILYQTYELFCMYMNGVLDTSSFISAGILISATLMTVYMIKNTPKEYVFVLSIYTGLLVFINNLSYFSPISSTFTDATGNLIYFWQTRNHLSSLFFIALISAFILRGIHRTAYSNIWIIFVLANVLWGVVMFNSSTTIVGVSVFLIAYILFRKKIFLYRPVILFFGALGLNLAIVFFRVQYIFSWLIENILNRSLSFTNRTDIWDTAILYIFKRPLFGYGESSIFSFSFARSEIPAHNQFLDVAIICGIPGVLLLLLVLFASFKKLASVKESTFGRTLTCALLGYVIMSIAESPNPYQPWFIIFGLIESVDHLDKLYIPGVSLVSLKDGTITIRRVGCSRASG